MNRRELFGLPLIPVLLGESNPSYRHGPKMDQLINLATRHSYYKKVLGKALKLTGPLADSRDDFVVTYFQDDEPPIVNEDGRYRWFCMPKSYVVLIPAKILPAIRPEHRGFEFPKNVPFVEAK